jgi:Protein of unknown function (DUF1353)
MTDPRETPVDGAPVTTVAEADASFRSELDVRYLDGHNWRVLSEFIYVPRDPMLPAVHIPVGFETDFASVPRFFWRIIHPTDRCIGKAGVIHDYIYRTPTAPVTRLRADEELATMMAILGASAWKRRMAYAAVRIGGRGAYRPRVPPEPKEPLFI